jgi:hypothetical protein
VNEEAHPVLPPDSSDPDPFSEQVAADTRARLADPARFLVEIIRFYWLEATAEEALEVWQRTVRTHPAYAIDVLNCLHQIIEDPPNDLTGLIVGEGEIIRYHTDVTPYRPYGDADYVAWLTQVYDEWAAVFASVTGEPSES